MFVLWGCPLGLSSGVVLWIFPQILSCLCHLGLSSGFVLWGCSLDFPLYLSSGFVLWYCPVYFIWGCPLNLSSDIVLFCHLGLSSGFVLWICPLVLSCYEIWDCPLMLSSNMKPTRVKRPSSQRCPYIAGLASRTFKMVGRG